MEPHPSLVAFGIAVSQRRMALGWSFDALAEYSDVSRRMLINVEHARMNPSLLTILKIAKALKVEPGELVNAAIRSVEPNQSPN